MNERIVLPRRRVQGRGRVTLRYTDPVTGKVLHQVRGENHVFTAQIAGTANFQSTAMKADLLLCQGGSYPYTGGEMKMPFIPGEPIGFGRPGAAGSGLYQGTYRASESWYNRATKTGVSAKYVYDFLPTQALGQVDWVGLTAALGSGAAAPAYEPPFVGFSAGSRVYDCARGKSYRATLLSVDSTYHVKLLWQDCYASAEEGVDLTELSGMAAFRTGTGYPRTLRVFLDQEDGTVYVMCRGTPTGTTTAVYKVLKVSADGQEVLNQWDITTGKEYVYETAACGAAAEGKLYWMVAAAGYRGYSRYVCDPAAGTITKTEVALEEACPDLVRWDETVAYLYGGCFWYARRDYNKPSEEGYADYFLYGSPLFNLSSGAVHGLVPPGPMEKTPGAFHVGPAPMTAFGGQWIKTCYDSAGASMPFAYTCYRMPEGTPQRPAGSAMTLTYELDVAW